MTTPNFALPYPLTALMPYLSGETLSFIVERILPRYERLKNPSLSTCPYHIELSHHYFWLNHLTGTPKAPSETFLNKIYQEFGSLEKLHAEFVKHAHRLDVRFVWLVVDKGKLRVVTTNNDSIFDSPYKPLLACNLWQHAYYLDWRDRADEYVKAWLTHLVDWQRVEFDYISVGAN